MRTIYPNAKAVGAVVLVVVLVVFLLVSIHQINFHLSSTEKSSIREVMMVPRDVVARRQMEAQREGDIKRAKKIEVPVNVEQGPKEGGVKKDGGEIVEPVVAEPVAPVGVTPPPVQNKNQGSIVFELSLPELIINSQIFLQPRTTNRK
jgi:hypothetical protein